jgi:4-hydroxy-tetrahydrodipicolinate synthase
MKKKEMLQLSGIIPPLVTPLLNEEELDIGGLKNLIEHVIHGGVNGLFILGTTGEFPGLSYSLKYRFIDETCKIVNRRLPVLVGITDTSLYETLQLAERAYESGADGLVIAPPFYYHIEQNELLDYFTEVAEKCKLPIFLYNMPARTNIEIEVETLIKAAAVPGIIGIKDSSGDLEYIKKIITAFKEREDFTVFIGPEEIMAKTVVMGAEGGVNGGANLFPRFFVKLYYAAVIYDIRTVNRMQRTLDEISTSLYKIGKGEPNFVKIIKESLHQKGICSEIMTKPYIPFSEVEKEQLSQLLDKFKNIESL